MESLFWAKVHKTDGCWLWLGVRNYRGYGQVTHKQQKFMAHRVAWSFVNGPIHDGLIICHHCDNPQCVRPDHLFAGTYRDNMLDAMQKGRLKPPPPSSGTFRGERNSFSKLTEASVREIRQRAGAGETPVSLASAFGVGTTTIKQVVRRRSWTHI